MRLQANLEKYYHGERVDLYDSHFMKTGYVIPRGSAVPADRYVLIIFICLFNSKGQMLIQRRQLTKVGWPGLWDVTAGGAVMSGESSEAAALRELKEELGITLKNEQLIKLLSLHHPDRIHDIYCAQMDLDTKDLQLQKEEVMDARWASLEQIEQMIADGSFIPVRKEFIQLLFAMKTRQGILL